MADIDHSYFLDRDENKGREIDLLAIYHHTESSPKKAVTVRLGLSVEVKKATSKPWIVFTSPLTQYDEIETLFETSLVRLHIQEIWFKHLYANHPVRSSQRFGRVSYQAYQKPSHDGAPKKPNDKHPEDRTIAPNFSAFVSSFKASADITAFFRQRNNVNLRDDKDVRTYEIGIVHGLIVVDGKLFEAKVSNAAELEIAPTTHVPYVFNYNSKEYGARRLLIDIVTLGELANYLRIRQEWIRERAAFCLSELS